MNALTHRNLLLDATAIGIPRDLLPEIVGDSFAGGGEAAA